MKTGRRRRGIRCPQENSATKLRAIANVLGAKKCLYSAAHGTHVPNSYDAPATDGPYSVNDYNVNVTNRLGRGAGRESAEYLEHTAYGHSVIFLRRAMTGSSSTSILQIHLMAKAASSLIRFARGDRVQKLQTTRPTPSFR